jgi:hypothetical protein
MFPGPGAQVYYNEAGEPLGWDYPNDDADSFYCDHCGAYHADGFCAVDDAYEVDDA